jgi:hypothetical protein
MTLTKANIFQEADGPEYQNLRADHGPDSRVR